MAFDVSSTMTKPSQTHPHVKQTWTVDSVVTLTSTALVVIISLLDKHICIVDSDVGPTAESTFQ